METSTGIAAITTAFTNGLTTIQSDAMSLITAALPIALGIAGVFMVVKLGVRFFRSVAG